MKNKEQYKVQLVPNHNLKTEVIERIQLTWVQRLFSWPWRPWVDHHLVKSLQPSEKLYQFMTKDRSTGEPVMVICGHPDTLTELKKKYARNSQTPEGSRAS